MCANVGAADEFSIQDYSDLRMDEAVSEADVVYLTRYTYYVEHVHSGPTSLSKIASFKPRSHKSCTHSIFC